MMSAITLEVTVARADPAAPNPQVKIKIGLRKMLMIVPAIEAIIDWIARPSVRRILVGDNPKMINAAPQAITR